MINVQLKLQLTKAQESSLNEWLFILTGVWNWAVRKIELDAKDGIYHSKYDLEAFVVGHSERIGVSSHTIQGVLKQAHQAWVRCFRKAGGRPKLKGIRNKLNSIPFPDQIRRPEKNRIKVRVIGSLKFHTQEIPAGAIKCSRIVKRSSGWYLCLFIDAERAPIQARELGMIGIDPGFSHLITTSFGEKVEHPRELQVKAARLAQAQRGNNKRLTARIHERIKNQRKDRNHKLSLRLVQENNFIAFSKDNNKGLARMFGKSVASSAHYQLRQMIAYKSRAGGTQYVEVASRNSTKTCSACGALTGPAGYAGLKVRQWACSSCGSDHDRDVNAAINTLVAGAGMALEGYAKVA